MKFSLSLTQRIYLSMLLLILITFLLVAFFSALYFKKQNEEFHYQRVLRKQQSVLASVNYFFTEERDSEYFAFYTKEFAEKINEFADINSIDIYVYDLEGVLLTTSANSQNSDLQRRWHVPNTILERLRNGETSILSEEIIKETDYISTFTYLQNFENEHIAIIGLPYNFATTEALQEFRKFLKNLLLIFMLVFPIGIFLAFLISRNLTKPIKALGQSIKGLKLGGENAALTWPHDDVIGQLIEEYNEKVKELETSARQLAQTEREIAWREMAKQVAHEIKNPLTPMKLSVQYLQRTWQERKIDFDERLMHFTEAMIEQIDTLAFIASEFSNFAKMPQAAPERVDLEDAIEKTKVLFEDSHEVSFECIYNPKQRYTALVDPNHLRRILNNLVKNAVQAFPENYSGKIQLQLSQTENEIKIAVIDNGTGIPKEFQERIFMPNFTTKTDGMGLGLAMVKSMIQSNRGQISFESSSVGTTFCVVLPKAEPQ